MSEAMAKGVWVKTDVIEGKLMVQPVSTLERPAYNQFLAKHFSSLDDGFFFRVINERINPCFCPDLFTSRDTGITYHILSPLTNLLFTGTMVDHEASADSLTTSIDSDSEVEDSNDSMSILLTDCKNKCLIRITFSKATYFQNNVIRVESPPGILLGWIRKRKRCLGSNVYQLYEGTEPTEPSVILRKCSRFELSDDDESHDIGCFITWLPCSQTGLKSSLFEIQEVVVTESKTQQSVTTEKGIGMVFGSQQTDLAMAGKEERITCSFQPGISYKKKVLILTSVIFIHLNRDIA